MKYRLVETHCHLDMQEFDVDRQEVIARAKVAGVGRILTIGIDVASSRRAAEIAEANEGIYATAGSHPHDAETLTEEGLSQLEELALKPGVVAIGEIGMDYHYKPVNKEAQASIMRRQLELAQKAGLPVVIHCRNAEGDMLEMLSKYFPAGHRGNKSPVGVVHCFGGDAATAARYLDMGFYISLGAYIGYPSSKQLSEVIRQIPLDRIMLETDSPFLPPQQYRGRRNEPSYIPFVLEALADITGIEGASIAEKTTQNAIRLFGMD